MANEVLQSTATGANFLNSQRLYRYIAGEMRSLQRVFRQGAAFSNSCQFQHLGSFNERRSDLDSKDAKTSQRSVATCSIPLARCNLRCNSRSFASSATDDRSSQIKVAAHVLQVGCTHHGLATSLCDEVKPHVEGLRYAAYMEPVHVWMIGSASRITFVQAYWL